MNPFKSNTYVKRIAGKPVKGILQDKPYKVQFASTRWVKLYGVDNKYSSKYFKPMEQTDILKEHLAKWQPILNEPKQPDIISERIIELCKLAYAYKAGDFLTEAIMKGLIK